MKMNCEQFDLLIDEFIEQTLDHADQSLARRHLDSCQRCTRILAEHRAYLALLRGMPVPQAPPGQLAHMLRQASRQQAVVNESARRTAADERTRGDRSGALRGAFMGGFATAAAIALVLLVGVRPPTQTVLPRTQPAEAIVSVTRQQITRQVTVVINVPADMHDASLALDFPASLRLQGLEELRHVAWAVDLEKGPNVLTLPLTIFEGTDLGATHTIAATVRYEDREKNFELPVELLPGESPLQGMLFPHQDSSFYHI